MREVDRQKELYGKYVYMFWQHHEYFVNGDSLTKFLILQPKHFKSIKSYF